MINDGVTAVTINGGTFDLVSFAEEVTPAVNLTNAAIIGWSAGFLLSRGGFEAAGTNTISKGISVRAEGPNSGRFAITNEVTTVSGRIQTDNGSVQGISKTGAGTLILAGANSYTGPTVLKSGTTIVSGSIASGSVVRVGDSANPGATAILGAPVLLAKSTRRAAAPPFPRAIR
ncbi:MAG: hypothetical protein JWL59_2759 [Chthoniobacteraceae bacterium]|nr:hypothetical protein [Chthoniobacteraceae bacterium]